MKKKSRVSAWPIACTKAVATSQTPPTRNCNSTSPKRNSSNSFLPPPPSKCFPASSTACKFPPPHRPPPNPPIASGRFSVRRYLQCLLHFSVTPLRPLRLKNLPPHHHPSAMLIFLSGQLP